MNNVITIIHFFFIFRTCIFLNDIFRNVFTERQTCLRKNPLVFLGATFALTVRLSFLLECAFYFSFFRANADLRNIQSKKKMFNLLFEQSPPSLVIFLFKMVFRAIQSKRNLISTV